MTTLPAGGRRFTPRERRAVHFDFKNDAGNGEFEGYASRFNIEDQGGDIVVPGAFRRTLRARGVGGVKLLFQHDARGRPLGREDLPDRRNSRAQHWLCQGQGTADHQKLKAVQHKPFFGWADCRSSSPRRSFRRRRKSFPAVPAALAGLGGVRQVLPGALHERAHRRHHGFRAEIDEARRFAEISFRCGA